MTIAFNGTGVSLYGAKRSNHGLYTVNMDGADSIQANGSSSTSFFQQTLYASNNLTLGYHSVTLENMEPNYVDIDYVSQILGSLVGFATYLSV